MHCEPKRSHLQNVLDSYTLVRPLAAEDCSNAQCRHVGAATLAKACHIFSWLPSIVARAVWAWNPHIRIDVLNNYSVVFLLKLNITHFYFYSIFLILFKIQLMVLKSISTLHHDIIIWSISSCLYLSIVCICVFVCICLLVDFEEVINVPNDLTWWRADSGVKRAVLCNAWCSAAVCCLFSADDSQIPWHGRDCLPSSVVDGRWLDVRQAAASCDRHRRCRSLARKRIGRKSGVAQLSTRQSCRFGSRNGSSERERKMAVPPT